MTTSRFFLIMLAIPVMQPGAPGKPLHPGAGPRVKWLFDDQQVARGGVTAGGSPTEQTS